MGFIFGGNTGVSGPEELARRRELAEALLLRGKTRAPQNVPEGLQALALAVRGRMDMNRLSEAEATGRKGATDAFNGLLETAPDVEPASYTSQTDLPEKKPRPDQSGFTPDTPVKVTDYSNGNGLDGEKMAFLDTIAGPESAGAYNVSYGGGKFDNYTDHPRRYVPITSGPNRGKRSSAAGRYQFLASTWDKQKADNNLPDFSPQSQDIAAWDLANDTFKAKTGGSLEAALKSGDITKVAQALNGTWTSMPGGIEQGIGGNEFANAYQRNLGRSGKSAQVAQAGNGIDPRLLQALGNEWMNPGQQAVVKALIEQQMKRAYPEPKEPYTLSEGQTRFGPGGSVLSSLPAKADKPTDDIAEYNFYVQQAKAAGQAPLPFDQYMQSMKKAGATSINMNTGEPGDSKLRGKLQEKEAESWSNFQTGAASASALTQQIEVLDELGKMAPQGGVRGRLAQTFSGFSTAGDAFMSIATRIAPSFREPGSGSTSDIEYQGFLNGLPRLQTTPGGNAIISQTIRNMAQIKMERGLIVDRYSNGEIAAPEARRQMAGLNKRSIMTPELQAVINANTEQPAAGTPDADGWVTMPNGTRVREKK